LKGGDYKVKGIIIHLKIIISGGAGLFGGKLEGIFSREHNRYGVAVQKVEVAFEFASREGMYIIYATCMYEDPGRARAALAHEVHELACGIPVEISHQFQMKIVAVPVNGDPEVVRHYIFSLMRSWSATGNPESAYGSQ
jgi:hypothetical protein